MDWAKYQNRHSSKCIWVMKLFFCQNSPLMGQSFWQKNSFITHILFEVYLFLYLAQSTYLWDTLYFLMTDQKLNLCVPNNCIWWKKSSVTKWPFWGKGGMIANSANSFYVLLDTHHSPGKGQLISKCPFGIIVWTKIPTKSFLDFCPEFFKPS